MKKYILKIWYKVSHIIYCLSHLILSFHKRNNDLIVYGGALDMFIDNAKHIFLLNNKFLPEFRHVWLTRNDDVLKRVKNLGFEAFKYDSGEGRKLLYNAGMVIYDNKIDEFASHLLSAGAIRFEIWHGVTCAKKIGLIRTDPPKPYKISSHFKYKYYFPHIYGDYVLSTSNGLRSTMSAAFQIPVENTVVADQPRNHVLFMPPQELDYYVEKYEDTLVKNVYNELKNENRRKVIYMPTFRDNNPDYIYDAINDWSDFNGFLCDNNIVLFLKVHRVTPLPQGLNYSNIKVLDNGLDVYPLLPLFDCMLTDYSSIMFDFALIKKPIIIYDFDLEEYVAKSRYVFKSFYKLLAELSEAKSYQDLKKLMTYPDSEIRLFPTSDYYDCPGNYSNIYTFIKDKLLRK